jgi:hypothetical protein
MQRFLLLLIPAALIAGQARYARLGDFDGKVEVQLQAADPWAVAERNLPLPESTWLRTSASSRLEIELDEGSAWRLGPNSQAEISDYSRLSTGQRVTLLSLDHGLAYFTGEPQGKDALTLVVPGAQVTFIRGARVRLEAQDTWSRISVIEGAVRFSSPAAEMDLHEGQSVRVEPANASRFFLDRSVAPSGLDAWSEDRDKALEPSASSARVTQRYGVKDLDTAGQWIETADLGMVWKPLASGSWTPFQKGRWRWYDGLGYTWVSDDSWGWLPYHYGRWARSDANGWVWAPGVKTVFKPGDVYWMLQGSKLAGWGPLAPAEEWSPASAPQLFSDAATTYAAFQADARLIDPFSSTARPAPGPTVFVPALPSPAFIAARLEALRPVLRAGSTRVNPIIPGVTFEDPVAPQAPEPPPLPPITDPGSADPSASGPPPYPQGPPPGVMYPPPPPFPDIIVITPPGNPDYSRRFPLPSRASGSAQTTTPATGAVTPPAGVEPAVTPPSTRPRVVPAQIPRVDPIHDARREPRTEATSESKTPPAASPPAVKPPEIRPRAVPVDVPRVEPSHQVQKETKAETPKTDAPGTTTAAKK